MNHRSVISQQHSLCSAAFLKTDIVFCISNQYSVFFTKFFSHHAKNLLRLKKPADYSRKTLENKRQKRILVAEPGRRKNLPYQQNDLKCCVFSGFVGAEQWLASTAQHSTAQHSTAQHSTAQHSTAQHSTAPRLRLSHNTSEINKFSKKLSNNINWLQDFSSCNFCTNFGNKNQRFSDTFFQ